MYNKFSCIKMNVYMVQGPKFNRAISETSMAQINNFQRKMKARVKPNLILCAIKVHLQFSIPFHFFITP